MTTDAHTAAWLAFLANPTPDAAAKALATPRPPQPRRFDYTDASAHFLDSELAVMRRVEAAHTAFVDAITTAKRDAAYNTTALELTDLLNSLADLRSDHITPTLRAIEDALNEREGESTADMKREHSPKVL